MATEVVFDDGEELALAHQPVERRDAEHQLAEVAHTHDRDDGVRRAEVRRAPVERGIANLT